MSGYLFWRAMIEAFMSGVAGGVVVTVGALYWAMKKSGTDQTRRTP